PPNGIPPGEVAALYLSSSPSTWTGACPSPALSEDAAVHGSGSGHAFHVVTDVPVTAYAALPFPGQASRLASATLLYPSTSWGTPYFAIGPHADTNAFGSGQLWADVVAAEDGTKLDVAIDGQTSQYVLSRGEILQWLGADPSGAVFQADKPIGVWTGNNY